MRTRWLGWMFTVLVMGVATPALAETYRVDLIVFLDKSAPAETGQPPAMPNLGRAVALDDAATLSRAGITLIPDEQFGLQEQWQRLRNAKRYQPLIRVAWTQTDPPAERGAALRLKLGQSQVIDATDQGFSSVAISPVEGTVALLLNQYLMVDADLLYTLPTASGYTSYPLRERRRMRRDELHYLDSPKLGIVARVSKAAP